MEQEIWKSVKGYEGFYEVSNFGRVRRIKRNHFNPTAGNKRYQLDIIKIMKLESTENGYMRATIYLNGAAKRHSVHRLIAEAFLPNPENKSQVNHINGVKDDNRLENLEWTTPSENVLHYRNVLGKQPNHLKGKVYGLSYCAIKVSCKKISGEYVGEYDSIKRAADELGINPKNITGNLIGHRKTTGGYIFSYA